MVEIPDDVAEQIAAWLRDAGQIKPTPEELAWADLLDPQPPTLREQVCRVILGMRNTDRPSDQIADVVLAVVADAPIEQLIALVGTRLADWLAAQPLAEKYEPYTEQQRDHDVRLLRGGSDV